MKPIVFPPKLTYQDTGALDLFCYSTNNIYSQAIKTILKDY